MNEAYDPANHLLLIAFIVFYWHLLRIWHQPPPSDQDDKTPGKKAAAGPAPELAGVALRQVAGPSATSSRGLDPAPAAPPEDALAAISAADETFDETAFLAGAARAYELIVNAYADADAEILKRLLDADAAKAFVDAISTRRRRSERLALTFIGIKDIEIVHAWADANLAEISVSVASEAVVATYAADGTVMDGDPEKVVQMKDRWTFARRLNSKNPNWKLAATEAG